MPAVRGFGFGPSLPHHGPRNRCQRRFAAGRRDGDGRRYRDGYQHRCTGRLCDSGFEGRRDLVHVRGQGRAEDARECPDGDRHPHGGRRQYAQRRGRHRLRYDEEARPDRRRNLREGRQPHQGKPCAEREQRLAGQGRRRAGAPERRRPGRRSDHSGARRQLVQHRHPAALRHRRTALRGRQLGARYGPLGHGVRFEPDGQHQPQRHRVDRGAEGCFVDGDLRFARCQRRGDRYDQKRARGQGQHHLLVEFQHFEDR